MYSKDATVIWFTIIIGAFHQNYNFKNRHHYLVRSIENNLHVTSLSLKAALLQLDFPAFLGESAWAAAPRGKAIAKRVPTNPIALTDFFTSAELHDPTITSEIERTVNEAVAIVSLATTSKGSALGLQALQTLLVLAKDHACAPGGPAAKATPVEAVEQAVAPIALPVRTDRETFGVPVATHLHRSCALRLGVDRLFDIGHEAYRLDQIFVDPIPRPFITQPLPTAKAAHQVVKPHQRPRDDSLVTDAKALSESFHCKDAPCVHGDPCKLTLSGAVAATVAPNVHTP